MNRPIRAFVVFGLFAQIGMSPNTAHATTIDPLTFEERIVGADFVGIVECEQAGGIVAKYKVIVSLKGPKAGNLISLRVAVNYWEPQFPIALCGQRFFVTAYKVAPSRIISTTSGGGVPLWWRRIPADYRLPLFQGMQFLAQGEEKSPEFQKTLGMAKELLALKPADQEAALLKAVIANDLFSEKWIGGERDKDKADVLRKRFIELNSASSLANELFQLAGKDPNKWAVRVRIVLGKGARELALEQLGKLPADHLPWDKRTQDELVKEIKERLGTTSVASSEEKRSAEDEKPSETQLTKLRADFAAGPKSEEFGIAFEKLTRFEPTPVRNYLIAWKNSNKGWSDTDRGYVLGSFFAWQCGVDRPKHLRELLKATDPFIRVAGAVYLCFEDAEAGITELRKLTSLEGDPGVWAALALARRGQKTAVPRVLEVFRELPKEVKEAQSGMAGVPHGNLQKRALVLLSNSAHAGNVPQFSLPEKSEEQFDYLVRWWRDNGDRVIMTDPWSQLLEKQKID
jgi:hypothetical protein